MAARKNFLYIYILAFFSGMCIMAIELSASRLMAPFFGTSTFVWTNVIGIIMVALSIGYLVGGKLADRRPNLEILLKILLAACAFLITIPFAAPSVVGGIMSVLRHSKSSFTFIFFGSLASITLLFSLPILLMGMTSPFLIRIVASREDVGNSAGHIFGISTIGSIVGTFLPILVFIPTFGTGRTILFFAVLLLGVTAAGFARKRYVILPLLCIVFLLVPLPAARKKSGLIYATESAYEYIEVLDNGRYRFLAYNNIAGFQTIARKDSPVTGYYFDYYSLLPYLTGKKAETVCLIGLGGGIIANQIQYFHKGVNVDGIEIDPKVITIAREYFALTDRTRVYNQDGRIFLNLISKKYDIIIVDAFTQQIYIPFHLTTENFFREAKQKMNAHGILAINLACFRDTSPLLKSVTNTLLASFRNVYRVKIPATNNSLILASDGEIDFGKLSSASGTELDAIALYSMRSFQKVEFDPGVAVLTDDRAPIEHMVDWELL
ncbi:MAG TPA: fused MFS/spermidine synthase [Thermodesulfovibrionales bacterium]|nr:fused MFS/spermidine synthase [Thermodesulfovibrionales bacterium]